MRDLRQKGEETMKLLRPILFIVGLVLIVTIARATFASKSSQQDVANEPLQLTSVDSALATKAQEHCWYSVKSRSNVAKATKGQQLTSTGGEVQRLGDLILVTGAMSPSVGDDRFYGCALYEYTQGTPAVMTSKTWATPPAPHAMIPAGFLANGRKM